MCRAAIKATVSRVTRCHVTSDARTTRAFLAIATGASSRLNEGFIPTQQLWQSGRRSLNARASRISTIYALSTAPGRAAIAVIRLSGPACLDIYRSLCPGRPLPEPRRATVKTLIEPGKPATTGNVLDSSALILYFPEPKTVTGESVLELHVHGGSAIVKAVLAAISRCTCSGGGEIRYAEPGEFTRRAFMNDRLDLTQVEALGDTLAASTEQQRRLSVRGTTNRLARHYEAWRQDLLYARGELEALIDFSEDQHFDESPSELCASVARQVRALQSRLRVHSQNAVRGEMLRHGISIALLGAPNVGKSSLLNRIVGREAAIVSHEAGTTRDVVEVGLDLGGYFCRMGDTAGLRKAKEEGLQHQPASESARRLISDIELEGMRRAKQRAAESDIVIAVMSFEPSDPTGSNMADLNLDPEVLATVRSLVQEKGNVTIVVNKSDLLSPNPSFLHSSTCGFDLVAGSPTGQGTATSAHFTQQIMHAIPGLLASQIHMISCKDPVPIIPATSGPSTSRRQTLPSQASNGIQSLLHGLESEFARLTTALGPQLGSEPSPMTNDPDPSIWQDSLGATERHRLLLDACSEALSHFLSEVSEDAEENDHQVAGEGGREADIVVAAEHLRAAAECLAKITGRGQGGDVDEVLGVVFEKFCVGK